MFFPIPLKNVPPPFPAVARPPKSSYFFASPVFRAGFTSPFAVA